MPPAESVLPDVLQVSALPGFSDLDPKEQSLLLSSTTLNKGLIKILRSKLGSSDQAWMKMADYVPDTEDLANQVLATARAFHEKIQAAASQ